MQGSRLLSVVLPAYNEGEAIEHALAALEPVLASLPCRSEVVVVNDGSRDDTLARARAFRSQAFDLVVVDLSRGGWDADLQAPVAAAEPALEGGEDVAEIGEAPFHGDFVSNNPSIPNNYIYHRYQKGIGMVSQHCAYVSGTGAYQDRLVYYEVN